MLPSVLILGFMYLDDVLVWCKGGGCLCIDSVGIDRVFGEVHGSLQAGSVGALCSGRQAYWRHSACWKMLRLICFSCNILVQMKRTKIVTTGHVCSIQRSPNPLAGFKGALSRRGEGEGGRELNRRGWTLPFCTNFCRRV